MIALLALLACRSSPVGPAPDADTDTAPSSVPATAETGERPVPRSSNVLVLLSDDQGVDSLGAYRAHPNPPPTPHLDQLASEGVLFRNAWAYPVCTPSRSALLTGRLGRRTGLGEVIQYRDREELPLTEVILPRLLEGAPEAWSTAAIGKWHLSSTQSPTALDHPLALGFDRFTGTLNNLGDHVIDDGLDHGYHHWEQVLDGTLVKNDTYATTFTVDEALRAIRELPEPWFVYVAFHAPHSPFDIPPDALTPTLDADPRDPKAARYPLVVEALDQEIGRLLRELGDRRERTWVIFASDNGTPEDAVRPPSDPSRAKNSPFEGGIHVPLLISGPAVVEPGREVDALVHLADVFPTVAEIAGAPLPPVPIDGRSLWPHLVDPSADGPPMVHTEKFLPNGRTEDKTLDWRMSRGERFKVIRVGAGLPLAVYDLAASPVELGPPLDVLALTPDEQGQVQQLITAHEAFFEEIR